MGKSNSYLVLLAVVSVLWGPVLSEKCAIACKGAATAPSFLNGHKYNYGLEGTVSVYLSGADKQETSVKLLGQVTVAALGNCGHELRVQNLVISGPDGKKYGSPNGIEKPIIFSLQDGRLGSEICAEEGDSRRSLNIKRAIISLLQSEQKPSSQVDIFGVCPTEASSSQEGGALLVHRSRDLSRCAHREQGRNDLISAVYNPTAEIKSTQVLQSSLHVESKVLQGVPEKVSATEDYLYKPFSVGENGARAKVHTRLTLTGKAAGAPAASQCTESRTVIFENPHGASSIDNAAAIVSTVKETAKTLGSEASSQSAGIFAQLIRIVRSGNKDALLKAYNQVRGNNLEKRVFLDALLRAGSGDSVEASIDILKKKELSPLEQNLVLLSLGNARHVDNDALKAAASLLDLPNLPREVYLGVGALAGAFCRDHSCHHASNDGIQALSQKLGAKLNCKAGTKTVEDLTIAVLKGIRSIRHLEDSLIEKLAQCAADNSVKARVRVAALEAFHADPCSAKLKKTALDLLKNRQLDSEIRINAYLAVVQCPCGKSANEIKTLLDSEPVHQVGRFISSSLRHIRSSANPDKQLAKQHYGQIRTPNKFNLDDRKYSFYREASYNIDALGLGGSIEESVIYSQDSFIPRSVNFNLTAELFGHNLNIFEVGARQGNLDRVVEHFLGPRSFLRREEPQAIYDKFMQQLKEAQGKVETLSRGRRSIKTEVDNFDKHLKAESEPFNNELDLDVYLKLFGTDAVFLSLGDDKGFDYNSLLDEIVKVVAGGFNKAKHFQQELRANLLFLDAELSYPTSVGLPLKLDLIGSATGRLDVATNVDVRQILKNPESAKVDIKLVPSTDIEIAGLFLIDADAVITGLKVITNLHSSTGGHLIAKVLENGRGIDIQFGLPIEKQEILTATNDLVFVTAEKGQKAKLVPLKTDAERKHYSGCFDQLSGLLGLTMCGEVSVPFSVSGPEAQSSISKFLARYPLSGSSKLSLVLEKNDLRGYHIKALAKTENQRSTFELLFEAEGSKNRRTQVSGELVNRNDERSIKLSLDSPIKVLYGEAVYIRKPSELSVHLKGKIDKAEYYARAGFNVQGNEKRSVFKPVLEYQLPEHGKQSLKVDGQLIREVNPPETKYSLEGIKITMPNSNEVVNIQGHLKTLNNGAEVDLKAQKGENNLAVAGSLKGHDVKLDFKNTLNPYVNFKANGHVEFGETVHNDLEVFYGGECNNPKNKFSFNQLLKYHGKSSEDFGLITKNKLEINAVPLVVKVNAEADPKKLSVDLDGQYADKKASVDLDARTQIKKPGDYSVKVAGNIEEGSEKKGIEILSKRDIVSPDKSNFENYVLVKNYGKYELSGVVNHKNKPNDVNVGAVGSLKFNGGGKSDEISFDVGLLNNNNQYSHHAKVSCTKGVILDYLLKLSRGANPNGQLKFILKDTVAANGQFKVTDNDGKGNGAIIVDFKKSQRKIKADVKFVAKEPVFNADLDLYLNFEKDNKDKVHLSTANKRTEKLVESKNKLEYGGKKTEVNVHHEGSLDAVGKQNALVEVILPTERCLSLKVERELNKNGDNLNGHADVVLSDAPKKGGQASIISYKAKLGDTNVDKNILNYDGQLELKLKDGKQLINSFSLKHVPEGEKFKFDFKSDVTGNLIPKPASVVASAVYVDSILDADDSYRMKASYGDDLGFEMIGSEVTHFPEKGDKKYKEDYSVNIRLPFEKAHDIKLASNVLFLYPENAQSAEFTIIESVQINSDQYKVDASGKLGQKAGNSKLKVLVPHTDPFVLEVNYKGDYQSEKKSGNVEIKTQYGKGKSATVNIDAAAVPGDYNLKIRANAPQAEKLKKLELSLHTKKPSADTYSSSLLLDADGKIYKYDSLVVYSRSHPVVDLKFSCPENKPGRIFYKGDYLSPSQGKAELKIENVRDFSIDATSEAEINNENVVLKAAATSEKLGLKNFKLEISSKDAANGKRLEIATSNDNKNILSGSTSFIRKQEGLKLIMEGSGSVKVKDQQKAANFKYIRTLLAEGNEQGVETFLNLAVDERSYVAEYRYTNLEYKSSYVYCEEKKQCAHMELDSKISSPSAGVYQHLLKVDVDLRKLGFAPEFGLQVSNEVSQKKLPQYTLDLHVNKEEKKYYIHAYSQPEHGKFPAGITITLPTRVLAAESLVVYPADKALPFPIKGEISLFPDKNKPHTKTGARILVDVTGDKSQHVALAEFGFSHPKIGKEALVKFRGNLLRPDEKSIKIETSATFSYPPAGSDRVSKILFEVNPSKVKLVVDTPIVQVISIEGAAVVKENLQEGDVKFSLLGGNTVQAKAIAKDYQYFEFTTGYSEQSDRKLSITAHVDPEKRVDISADIVLPDQKKNIVHGALFLQDNLVKSDYGASKDNFNYFVAALKNDMKALEARIKAIGEKASEDFKTSLSKLQPNLKKLEQAYVDDLEKLYQEVSNDKVLKDISKALHDVIQYVSKLVEEVSRATKPIVDKISATLQELSQKIKDMYEKQLEPQLKQLYANVAAIIKEYFEGLLDVVAHFAALVNDFYEKHKPEIQELVDTFTEIFKDLTRLIVAQLKELRAKLSHFFTNFSKQFHESIDQLPVVGMLKEKLAEFSVPEQLVAVLQDGYKVIRDLLPTTETKNFADALFQYIQKKVNKQKVDDAEQLRIIYEKLVVAINSVFQFLRNELNQIGVPAYFSSGAMPFFSGLPQGSWLPALGGPPSFSAINQLLRGDLIDPISVIKAYRPRSLNPLDEIPAKLRAVVVNGQHIFTFDGRHLTFPGSCRYVLAHDHVDRNFTLILQLQNGSPKSLVLEDKSGITIELKDNGQVAVNGAAHGFPVMEKESFAFKQTNGRIGLGSLYGIMAFCTGKLEVCYIEVSGFYLGKLRGLLGDGNNEPFDDFRLPNGKISPSESEFGNAYRLASSCAQVKVPEHSHHQMHQVLPKACDQVFGASSPLRPLALVLDAAPFRQACIHAVSADSANALHQACDLARGYAALAVSGLLPAVLPPVCVQCTDAGQPKNVGDVYEVKLPNKLADIVVAVETTKSNEKNYKDLVVPLVSQLVDNLKAKHITDIKVYLVGITSKIPYPIVYDTDLKLKNPKVQFTDESRYKTYKPVHTGIEKVDKASQVIVDIVQDLRIKLGLTNVVAGYNSLIELPLRPGAVKHTIGAAGEICRNQFALLQFLRVVAYDSIFEQNAQTNTMIVLTPDLKIGAGKDPKQIVGFSEDSVLLLGDKKKSKESEALRATLELEQEDGCLEFTEETGGLILSASNFHALNPAQQKQYLQTAASAISARLLQDNIVQECVCSYVDPFRVRSVCSNKERKAAPARRRK